MATATMPVREVALPSDQMIPAVSGEFYSYTADFSMERPLYFFLKCKSNKAWPITRVEQMLQELDLTFIFGENVFLCSPNSAPSIRLLSEAIEDPTLRKLSETEIRPSNMSPEEFYRFLDRKSGAALVDAFRVSGASESAVLLSKGMTLSIRTASSKYGLILLKDLTPSTCKIDACHILVL